MGETLLELYRTKLKKSWKTAFYAAFLACLLVHLYKFTNTLPNHDSFYNVYTDQNMTASGRWFLTYVCGISSYFDLPWLNGLLSAVYLGITAAIVAEIFDLTNPVVIVLTGAILAASPCTTETFFFEFTADGYLLGLLLSALAACLSCKGTGLGRNLLSCLFLCLSCAVYQAYVSFGAVLCICYLVHQLLNSKMTVRDAWKWIGRHVLIYVIALAAYYGLWKLILLVTGQEATSYQGISGVGQIRLSTLIGGAVKSVINLGFFFLEWNIFEHPITLYAALNIVFLLCFAAVIIVAMIKGGMIRKPAALWTVIFALVSTVPLISVWCLLSDGVSYRPMMLHSVCVYYIFSLILFDKWVKPEISTIFGLFMAVVVFNFALMANISYFYLDKCYEKSYYMGSQMMEDIEETVRESDGQIEEIAFVGNRYAAVDISATAIGNRIHMLSTLLEEDLLYDHEHVYLYLHNVFNLDISLAKYSLVQEFENSKLMQSMDSWPSENSMRVVEGVLVVKLSDEVVKP